MNKDKTTGIIREQGDMMDVVPVESEFEVSVINEESCDCDCDSDE